MIKRSEAAAAVRPGPAAPIRLTGPSFPQFTCLDRPGRAGAAASFRLRIAGPAGSFRVSLGW